MANTIKKIEKEIAFFMYEEFTSQTFDDLLEFFSKNEDVLISNVSVYLAPMTSIVSKIELGINISGGVVKSDLKPNVYYYFKGKELNHVDNIDNVTWW